jgi:hypothetical protein
MLEGMGWTPLKGVGAPWCHRAELAPDLQKEHFNPHHQLAEAHPSSGKYQERWELFQ